MRRAICEALLDKAEPSGRPRSVCTVIKPPGGNFSGATTSDLYTQTCPLRSRSTARRETATAGISDAGDSRTAAGLRCAGMAADYRKCLEVTHDCSHLARGSARAAS